MQAPRPSFPRVRPYKIITIIIPLNTSRLCRKGNTLHSFPGSMPTPNGSGSRAWNLHITRQHLLLYKPRLHSSTQHEQRLICSVYDQYYSGNVLAVYRECLIQVKAAGE